MNSEENIAIKVVTIDGIFNFDHELRLINARTLFSQWPTPGTLLREARLHSGLWLDDRTECWGRPVLIGLLTTKQGWKRLTEVRTRDDRHTPPLGGLLSELEEQQTELLQEGEN